MTTPVSWPSGVQPAEATFGLKANTQVSVSDLSGYVQTVELPGARWSLSFVMPTTRRNANGAALEAFILSLRGQAVRATVPVFGRSRPQGTWGGTIVVDNEYGSPTLSQTGGSLRVRGGSAGATVKAGDLFNLGTMGQLCMATADVTLDGSGKGSLDVQPGIRSAPADGTVLDYTDPYVPYVILTDPHQKWRMMPGDLNEYAFDFIEVFG